MKRSPSGKRLKGRTIWTEDEDKSLDEAIRRVGITSWRKVSEELCRCIGGTKSGKQCRERYRNYLCVSHKLLKWKREEKLLFILCHLMLKNQWVSISRFFPSKSDICLKNRFYSRVRKALKKLKKSAVPVTVIRSPEKFYCLMKILETLRYDYLSNEGATSSRSLAKSSSRSRGKEKIILELLKKRKVTKEVVVEYENLLKRRFSARLSHTSFPVKLTLDRSLLKLNDDLAKELFNHSALFNNSDLASLIVVELRNCFPESQSPEEESKTPVVFFPPPLAPFASFASTLCSPFPVMQYPICHIPTNIQNSSLHPRASKSQINSQSSAGKSRSSRSRLLDH